MEQEGQIIGGTYRVIEQIGAGGGGVVYKAFHINLQKYVAIKEIKANVRGKLNERAEADILKNLKHQGLPQVYDIIQEDGKFYTVMEFIEGTGLDVILAKKRVNKKLALKWTTELCEAVAYLHSRKPAILHSDIKPANIIITEENKVCLIDFNIAAVFSEEGNQAIGASAGYAPPEQYGISPNQKKNKKRNDSKKQNKEKKSEIKKYNEEDNDETVLDLSDKTTLGLSDETMLDLSDETVLDIDNGVSVSKAPEKAVSSAPSSAKVRILTTESDVYSIGAVAYHMLTGIKPAHAKEGIVSLAALGGNYPASLSHIITKAIAADPAKRYSDAGEMLKGLKNIKKSDRRYRGFVIRRELTVILLIAIFAAGSVSAINGKKRMEVEKVEHYDELVSMIEEAENFGDTEAVNKAYDEAIALFPERPEAYCVQLQAMYNLKETENIQQYILETLEKCPAIYDYSNSAMVFFILGNTYFDNEDYTDAIQNYRIAIQKNPTIGDYYRDYAISLVRIGQVGEAESVLAEAIANGLSGDAVNLVNGEIEYVNGKNEEALASFQKCISETKNDYVKMRAYSISSEILATGSTAEEITVHIELLEEAIKDLPAEYSAVLRESLGMAYSRYADASGDKEYYLKAGETFKNLDDTGFGAANILMSAGISYQQYGDIETAEEIYLSYIEKYEESYTICIRLAILQAEKQAKLENQDRNYSVFVDYYEKAKKHYEEDMPSGYSDAEMDKLQDIYDELVEKHWIEE